MGYKAIALLCRGGSMTEKLKNTMTLDTKLPALQIESFLGRAFLRKEIVPLVKVSGRSIQYYTDLGLVVPQIHNPSGKGTKRLYSTKNVFELLLIQLIIQHGMKLSDVKPIIVKATTQWMKNPRSKTLVIYTYEGSNSQYDVLLYEEDYLNLEINMKNFESILILDISSITQKISII